MTPATLAAFALLVAGVAVSARTRLPGVVFSISGVYLYWWETGYTEPETVTLALLTAVVVLVLVGTALDRFISARVGGASTITATAGGFVGAAAFAFLGTTGLVLGTTVTVFVLEYLRRRDAKRSFVAALAVVFGTFASRLIQLLMAVLMLLVMVAVAL